MTKKMTVMMKFYVYDVNDYEHYKDCICYLIELNDLLMSVALTQL